MRALYIFIFGFIVNGNCYAQSCKTTAKFINNPAELRDTMLQNPAKRLVMLEKEIPGIALDLRYATANNFTHVVLYKNPVAYMRTAPAQALKKVQQELRKQGLGLKIYDAFRPFSATCKMWRVVPDRRYAANPLKGSNHNCGLAVDLTLVNLKTGKELDMGTPFDNFTDTAHHSFSELPPDVLANRKLLKQIMWKYGFNAMPTEWWHYQWRTKDEYEVIDLDFAQLKEIL
jgi:D-alanyl-D-alanine dipeptidase